MLHNLMDDLGYRVYSNMGREPFEGLDAGMFLVGRIVPVHPDIDAWLVSGTFTAYPAESAPEFAQAALQALTASPGLMRRNADKLRRSWEMQAEARADFVDFFGSDLVVLPPVEAQESLREHHRRRLEKVPPAGGAGASVAGIPGASSPGPEELSQFPEELLVADSVAVLYDEVEGLGYYEDFGRLDELFANPSLARDRERLALLRGYSGTTRCPRRSSVGSWNGTRKAWIRSSVRCCASPVSAGNGTAMRFSASHCRPPSRRAPSGSSRTVIGRPESGSAAARSRGPGEAAQSDHCGGQACARVR
ncbi:hypothetical protein ACWGI0_07490 [Streptomyces sp. NPDC054802]